MVVLGTIVNGDRMGSGGGRQGRRWPWWVLLLPLLAIPVLVGLWVLAELQGQADEATAGVSDAEAFAEKVKVWQIAAAAAVGAGGLITLATVFHRQALQARTAADTRYDADEKRAQELFVKAVEQLGHEKAAVRVGALHALDALGQEHVGRRRAVMDVWCAYLRMPPPTTALPKVFIVGAKPTTAIEPASEWPAEELHVRATAQRLITAHLRPSDTFRLADNPKPAGAFWGAMDIDLSGADLREIDFRYCRILAADFDSTSFAGNARFTSAWFGGSADFFAATFAQDAEFSLVTFAETAVFSSVRFGGDSTFIGTRFDGNARFEAADFIGSRLVGTIVHTTNFGLARFTGNAEFRSARLTGHIKFDEASFAQSVKFDGVTLTGSSQFDATSFADPSQVGLSVRVFLMFRHSLPAGWWAEPSDGSAGRVLRWDPALKLDPMAPDQLLLP